MIRCWIAALILLAPTLAHGDDRDIDPASRARAEALFAEGLTLLEQGDATNACPKLEGAVALTRGDALGGKLVLARCYEKAGRTASAWGLYREVAARAAEASQSERAKEADLRVEALTPTLRSLRLELSPALLELDALEVLVGDRALPRGSLTTPLPVDPGEITIALRAPGFLTRRQLLTVPATPGISVVVLDEPLVRAPVTTKPTTSPPPMAAPSFWSAQRIAGLTIGLVGLGGLGAGGIVGGIAKSDYDDALVSGRCAGSPPVCDDASAAHAAERLGDVATVVFFSGVGVTALGAVLFISAPSDAGTTSPTLSVRWHPGGATLGGSF